MAQVKEKCVYNMASELIISFLQKGEMSITLSNFVLFYAFPRGKPSAYGAFVGLLYHVGGTWGEQRRISKLAKRHG